MEVLKKAPSSAKYVTKVRPPSVPELDIEGYFPFIIYFYLISIFSFGQSNKKVRCDKVPLCVRPKEINCLFPVTARKKIG